MKRCDTRIRQAKELLNTWNRKQAFMVHFRQTARQHKEWGGRDRREIADLCFAWFRLGPLQAELKDTAFYWATWLFLPDKTEWLEHWHQEGFLPAPDAELSFEERLKVVRRETGSQGGLFPFPDTLSKEISVESMEATWGETPKLWFRVNKGKTDALSAILKRESIPFELEGNTFSLPPGTDMQAVSSGNYHVFGEIQDWASQQVVKGLGWDGLKVWDCCAASGGKALHLMDEYPGIKLTCTDIRPGILANLKERFVQARAIFPLIKQLDLGSDEPLPFEPGFFDGLLCDAPCSGSGTFRRNPEAMVALDEKKLAGYIALQRRIVQNALPALKTGGKLLYATCSMYAAENEEQVSFFESIGLKRIESGYFNGSERGADILYRAVLKKP